MSNYTKFFGRGAADLQRILKRSLLVRDVAVDLKSCQPDDIAETVRLEMKRSEFDIMGYKVGDMVKYKKSYMKSPENHTFSVFHAKFMYLLHDK